MLQDISSVQDAGLAEHGSANSREAALITRIAQGDLRAFESLYRGYFPRLCRFLDRMTRRPDLVEEILNDTMLVVSQKAHTYNLTAKVSTWIFAIAYRKALKALRDLDEPQESVGEEPAADSGSEPREQLMQLQLRRMLTEAVNALSADHRAVIELTYFHGADYREIAAIMDCPVATVKTRMFHARRRLKALLPDCLEDVL